MPVKTSQYILPHKIAKLKNLSIKAKTIVEGLITGLHKSPHHGFNVEFKEHRQYNPGDDIKHIDWRIFAKTDKFFIKRFEEETNLFIYILLDTSLSMGFKSPKSLISKLEYSKYLTASILYLALLQNDAGGLTLFSKNITDNFSPKKSYAYINEITKTLETVKPGAKSEFKNNFTKIAEQIKKRSLIIIVSDFLGDLQDIIDGLKHLKSKKNDILLFVIHDRAEYEFPYKDNIKFIDMEKNNFLILNAYYINEEYRKNFYHHYAQIKSFSLKSRIDYFAFDTQTDFGESLNNYLIKRNEVRFRK
ncbi:MAG: DUF58 domain-containing protein [Spirochaetes bacterium]|nr:DUF58 domain-containing protein [Spirochaetota bacterium]